MSEAQTDINQKSRAFLSGYKTVSVRRAGIMAIPTPKLGARFEVDSDLTPLFPYINSFVEGTQYYDSPERIQIILEGISFTLFSHEIIAAPFSDHDQVNIFGEKLLDLLNEVFDKKNSIGPNYRKLKPLAPLDIYKILPKTNCSDCGMPSCLAFASAMSRGETNIGQCPHVVKPIEEKAVYPIVDKDGRLTDTVELDLPLKNEDTAKQQSRLVSLLTERELQVLKLISQGLTNPQISEQLFISPHTVKTHVVHIYEKLGVNDRAQAAVLASRYNLV